jgi:bifunctional ADP-heptose synthase (sugar kinase/adenylyltransferase)
MKRILIIGESCLDVFVYCDALRLAPDLPIPVLQVLKRTHNPGMAKNVERNVKALYKACDLITNKNWKGTTKTRYMHDKTNHAFLRVDVNQPMQRIDVRKLPLKKYDLIAISDYDKGFLDRDDMRYICEHHPNVFIDTKKPVGSFLDRCAYIKINEKEYGRSLPVSKSLKRKIIITKGDQGAEFKGKHYPTEKIEVKDSSGAGDSFFAALIVRYIKTGNIEDAIKFANMCATQAVKHRGVSVIKEPKVKPNEDRNRKH